MKAIGKIIGRLIVGCVFACCLTTNLFAQMPPGFMNGGSGGTNIIYSTNTSPPYVPGLKLAVQSLIGTNLFLNLREADPAGTYDIFAASNLVSASWNDVLGGTNGQTNFTLPIPFAVTGFFRAARTDTPVVNTAGMTASFLKNIVNNNLTSAIVSGGPAAALAVLVNNTNLADAVWLPFSAGPNVLLGTNDGTYSVMFGFIGSDGQTNWTSSTVTLDSTPPSLLITSPTNPVISQPVIQLTGYSPEALSSLSYDITNASGLATNQQVFVLDQFYNTNVLKFTTNTFQAFDIPLTNGLNTITLHATDLAGNVTTLATNITLDYSGKTNPPVLLVNWPLTGLTICGSNFTCNGSVSDPTASITVQVVDASGDTNVVNASVGRDGNFFAEYLPLSGGTNYLTLTATDATGMNSYTTNLMVIQGDIALAVNLVSAGQTAVTGEIDSGVASDYTIWVNGSQATNNGDGTWSAQIASFSVGGGMVEAKAILNSDHGGNGSGGSDAAGNPNSAQAQEVQTPVKAPEGIYFSMYQSFEQYDFSNWGDEEIWFNSRNWHDGQGGSAAIFEYYDWDSYFPWLGSITWPAASWPQTLHSGTGTKIEWNLSPTNIYNHPWSTTNVYYAASPSMIKERCQATHSDWWATSLRQADSQIKLATGGWAGSTKMNLWVISASATAINPPYSAYPSTPWTGASSPIAPQNISIFGKTVGSDGNLYLLLPDNTNLDATPIIAGAPAYYTYNVTAQKYRLNITANGNPLAEDRVRREAYFCVGQKVVFQGVFSPATIPGLDYTSPTWNYTADYINNHWTDANGCEEYNIAPIPVMSNPTTTWFYNKQTQDATANLGMYCKFNNGQSVYLVRQGKINVFTPSIQFYPESGSNAVVEVRHDPVNGNANITYLGIGDDDQIDAMRFSAMITSVHKFPGQAIATQLINRQASIDSIPFGTGGTNDLDKSEIYSQASLTNNPLFPNGVPQGQVEFFDAPGIGLSYPSPTPYIIVSGAAWASCNDHFNTYFRFKPDGDSDNIYVTLARVDWDWHGGTDYIGGFPSDPYPLTNWQISGTGHGGPDFHAVNDFPIWPAVYSP